MNVVFRRFALLLSVEQVELEVVSVGIDDLDL